MLGTLDSDQICGCIEIDTGDGALTRHLKLLHDKTFLKDMSKGFTKVSYSRILTQTWLKQQGLGVAGQIGHRL